MSGKIITAQIKKISPHFNAKKLKICTVFTGQDDIQVVCGAANAYEGMMTILAEVGSLLPDGRKIEKANLRGAESLGMLCSPKELGLAEENGIIDLPPDSLKAGVHYTEIPQEALSSIPWFRYQEQEAFWESPTSKNIIITRPPQEKPVGDYQLISKTYWNVDHYLYRNF